jgi:peptidoglycan/LPS O-acetylase OafA/YrhL
MNSAKNLNYYTQLDGLRFLAVSAVMWGHWGHVDAIKSLNYVLRTSGVDLFFVLSGFLITEILIKSKTSDIESGSSHWYSLRQFYIRRFLRIFPIYYLLIFFLYIINFEVCRKFIWWLITYTVNICTNKYGMDVQHFAHLWSLSVEEQFYLVFPLFVFLIPQKFLLKGLLTITILAPIFSVTMDFIDHDAFAGKVFMYNFLDCFGIGGILAYYKLFYKDQLVKILKMHFFFITSAFIFLICVCWAKLPITYNQLPWSIIPPLFTRLSFAVCCFWIIGVSVTNGFKGFVKKNLENRVVVYLGKISYGLYLYHFFMTALGPYLRWQVFLPISIHFHFTIPFSNNPYLIALWYFAVTLCISALSWHFIEKPMNSLKRYFEYNKLNKSPK